MKRVKTMAIGICCALAMTSVGACGSSSGGGTKTIEFMTMQASGTQQFKAIEKIAKKFEAKNKDITIKLDRSVVKG